MCDRYRFTPIRTTSSQIVVRKFIFPQGIIIGVTIIAKQELTQLAGFVFPCPELYPTHFMGFVFPSSSTYCANINAWNVLFIHFFHFDGRHCFRFWCSHPRLAELKHDCSSDDNVFPNQMTPVSFFHHFFRMRPDVPFWCHQQTLPLTNVNVIVWNKYLKYA